MISSYELKVAEWREGGIALIATAVFRRQPVWRGGGISQYFRYIFSYHELKNMKMVNFYLHSNCPGERIGVSCSRSYGRISYGEGEGLEVDLVWK